MTVSKKQEEQDGRLHVLVVDDDETIRRSAAHLLGKSGYRVNTAGDGEEGLAQIQELRPAIVLLDLRMPKVSGMEVIERAIAIMPDLAIVVMTAHGTIEAAVETIQRGAFDFITKPFERNRLIATVDKARRYHSLVHENRSLRRLVSTQNSFGSVITLSTSMRRVVDQAMVVAPTPSSLLFLGESGTGKELLARTAHSNSGVASGPFHAINIGGIPQGFFESELFGHKRGAFTGAVGDRAGALETASGGTLFLDEIGELPKEGQVKLLRVLQEREYSRLGEDKRRRVNVRFMAATNRNLKKEVEDGAFREDLYYRICVVPIEIPPLRQRAEDIPALAANFLDRAARRLERPVPKLSHEALTELCRYSFPGNVRELENLMERIVALNLGELVRAKDLSLNNDQGNLAELIFDKRPNGIDLQDHESELIRESLKRSHGNQTKAAKLLGITRSALIYRMDKYRIKDEA